MPYEVICNQQLTGSNPNADSRRKHFTHKHFRVIVPPPIRMEIDLPSHF
jgi:hypothetical protein